jgi:hypothetical protein
MMYVYMYCYVCLCMDNCILHCINMVRVIYTCMLCDRMSCDVAWGQIAKYVRT